MNKKSLVQILEEAKQLGFSKHERHDVADVYRFAFRAAVTSKRIAPELLAEDVSRQYMQEEIDKWSRRGYK